MRLGIVRLTLSSAGRITSSIRGPPFFDLAGYTTSGELWLGGVTILMWRGGTGEAEEV